MPINFHYFHVLSLSSWPVTISFALFLLFSSILFFFKFGVYYFIFFSFIPLAYFVVLWTSEVKKEGMLGYHTSPVKDGLKLGFLTFIFTEVMLFVSFFWGFFDSSMSTVVDSGMQWPPYFISPLNPFDLPLMNTMLLLFSSVLLTWAHMMFFNNEGVTFFKENNFPFKYSGISSLLIWTLLLGMFFVYLQYVEYTNAPFTFSDSVYGSLFYSITGLHGSHVMLGGVFLLAFLYYYWKTTYSVTSSLWIDLSSLYWHFVDVVWFFVWGFLYIWSF